MKRVSGRQIAVIAAVAAVTAGAGSASPAAPQDKVDCAQEQTTQFAMNLCAHRAMEQSQAMLDGLLEELGEKYAGSADGDSLLAIQKEWVEFRDLDCSWESGAYAGGSIEPLIHSNCLTARNLERIDRLRIFLCDGGGMTGPCEASERYSVEDDGESEGGAISVSLDGEVLFYILHLVSDPLRDSDTIDLLMTDNPTLTTAEGIGPGTPIEQVERVYGSASLNYHTANESREYVEFADLPYPGMSFSSDQWRGMDFAGLYPDASGGEYFTTARYRDGATIGAVLVSSF